MASIIKRPAGQLKVAQKKAKKKARNNDVEKKKKKKSFWPPEQAETGREIHNQINSAD